MANSVLIITSKVSLYTVTTRFLNFCEHFILRVFFSQKERAANLNGMYCGNRTPNIIFAKVNDSKLYTYQTCKSREIYSVYRLNHRSVQIIGRGEVENIH